MFQLSDNERQVHNWLAALGRGRADQRIATLLLDLHGRLYRTGPANGDGFSIPITQDQIADHLELTRVHVNRVLRRLSDAGIATEVVMDGGKLAKQFKYADRAGIRFVLVLGSDEIAKGTVTVKDMRKQDQFEVKRDELVKTLRVELEQAEAMP